MSCVLLSCLTALQTPALAVAIYDAFAEVTVSPGTLAPGIGISFFQGSTVTPNPNFFGNAFATSSAQAPPSSAIAVVAGGASSPPDAFAASFASAVSSGFLFNGNATNSALVLNVSRTLFAFESTLGSTLPATASADFLFQVLVDGVVLTQLAGNGTNTGPGAISSNLAGSRETGTESFIVQLTPGFHSLLIEAQADGFARAGTALSPVPEPTTLIFFGTTAAGIGLARWRRRRQN